MDKEKTKVTETQALMIKLAWEQAESLCRLVLLSQHDPEAFFETCKKQARLIKRRITQKEMELAKQQHKQ